MITDLFTVENGKVKPTMHCQLIPEFKIIIDKYPLRSTDMLAYCFYYACPFKSINPFADYSDDDREDALKKSFVVFVDNPDILRAIETMKSLYETTTMRYFQSIKGSLDNMMDYLNSTTVITDDRDGNLTKIHNIQKDAGRVMTSFVELEKQVEGERSKLKAKANRQTGRGEL